MAIGSDDTIYIANKGFVAGAGEVIEIKQSTLVPEPSTTLGFLAFSVLGVRSLNRAVKIKTAPKNAT